ncbi:hypothetical protein HNP40_000738 [Mycobacteroides chelonae]|nr:hypothetical protein [Mycobacteroides chelonae]
MTEEQFSKQFAKLYVYMDRRFDAIETELAKKADKTEIDGIYVKLDSIEGRLDVIETELGAINVKLDRHERWHHQVADHVGLELQYDA